MGVEQFLKNLRTEESSHGMAVTFSYIWFGTWEEVCAWLFLMPTDTPLGFEGAKKQNSYQKRLWKTTYDKKTEAVKRHMPSWREEHDWNRHCRFFVASIPTQFVFDQCYNRHGCSFSFQEVLRVGTPTSHSAMPWQFSKESIAFSEWCQNSNWHLVLTCQEIKVQGRSWTFRYLLNYWSWQKS